MIDLLTNYYFNYVVRYNRNSNDIKEKSCWWCIWLWFILYCRL